MVAPTVQLVSRAEVARRIWRPSCDATAAISAILCRQWAGQKGETYTLALPRHEDYWICTRWGADGSSEQSTLRLDKSSGLVWWGNLGAYCFDAKELCKDPYSISWHKPNRVQGEIVWWVASCRLSSVSDPTTQKSERNKLAPGRARVGDVSSATVAAQANSFAAYSLPGRIMQDLPKGWRPLPGLDEPTGLELFAGKLTCELGSGLEQAGAQLPPVLAEVLSGAWKFDSSIGLLTEKLPMSILGDETQSGSDYATKEYSDNQAAAGWEEAIPLPKWVNHGEKHEFADDPKFDAYQFLDGCWLDMCGVVGTINNKILSWAHPTDGLAETQLILHDDASIEMEFLGETIRGTMDKNRAKLIWSGAGTWWRE